MRLIDYPQSDAEQVEVAGLNPVPDTVIIDGRRLHNRFKRTDAPTGSNVVKSIHVEFLNGRVLVTLVCEVAQCIDTSPLSSECHMAFTIRTTQHWLTTDELFRSRAEIEQHAASGATVTHAYVAIPEVRSIDLSGLSAYMP